jgi:hypothetical protein
LQLDEQTAVVVDIDKTALGAKGRNDHVIDRARLEGIFRTMTAVLGEDRFDRPRFIEHYSELNRGRYHFLTADNQDYLAYICLVLNTGLISFEELIDEIQQGSLENFDQFIRWVDSRLMLNETDSETAFGSAFSRARQCADWRSDAVQALQAPGILLHSRVYGQSARFDAGG